MAYELPDYSCDTHVHVFDPDRFPYQAGRSYTPAQADLRSLSVFHARLGVSRTILVQPSVYGTDNTALIQALSDKGAAARAIAVIDPRDTSDDFLDSLCQLGVVGVRANFESSPRSGVKNKAEVLRDTVSCIKGSQLILQIYCSVEELLSDRNVLESFDVPIILDHFAGLSDALSKNELKEIIAFLVSSDFWIKFSAPYRTGNEKGCEVLSEFALALIQAIPEKLIWGSDWPHTGGGKDRAARSVEEIEPFRDIDVPRELVTLRNWCASEKLCNQVLVENPAKLFRF